MCLPHHKFHVKTESVPLKRFVKSNVGTKSDWYFSAKLLSCRRTDTNRQAVISCKGKESFSQIKLNADFRLVHACRSEKLEAQHAIGLWMHSSPCGSISMLMLRGVTEASCLKANPSQGQI